MNKLTEEDVYNGLIWVFIIGIWVGAWAVVVYRMKAGKMNELQVPTLRTDQVTGISNDLRTLSYLKSSS